LTHVRETAILRVQAAETGEIWYASGIEAPVCAQESLGDFVSSALLQRHSTVRLLANTANLALINRLYAASVVQLNRPRVELGSAALLPGLPQQKRSPAGTLIAARQTFELSPSLGGWQRLNVLTFPSYAMAYELQHQRSASACALMRAWHPAWPYLSFIPHLDPARVCELLSVILDPRWYVDCDHPDRSGRLKNFLGVNPRYAKATPSQASKSQLYQLALQTWKNPVDARVLKNPGSFLWRAWYAVRDARKADLRVTQRFIVYLRQTWLDALYRTTRPAGESAGFCPEHYFRDPVEVAGFKYHLRQRAEPTV
jgi:hypothetical protein